jgi:hypothetical protein
VSTKKRWFILKKRSLSITLHISRPFIFTWRGRTIIWAIIDSPLISWRSQRPGLTSSPAWTAEVATLRENTFSRKESRQLCSHKPLKRPIDVAGVRLQHL